MVDRDSGTQLLKRDLFPISASSGEGSVTTASSASSLNNLSQDGFSSRNFLPGQFKPGDWDVVCHKGHAARQHVGNRRFKICVGNYFNSYIKSTSKSRKSAVTSDIVATIRESSHGGGFVRFDPSRSLWYEIGDRIARDKVGQTLRDVLRDQKEIQRRARRTVLPFPLLSPTVLPRRNNVATKLRADEKGHCTTLSAPNENEVARLDRIVSSVSINLRLHEIPILSAEVGATMTTNAREENDRLDMMELLENDSVFASSLHSSYNFTL